MRKISLSKGKFAMVDDCDYKKLSEYKWYYTNWGYAVRNISINRKQKLVYMHRVILSAPDGLEVDHRDGNKLNNQSSNLRVCTQSENQHNRTKYANNKTGFKGVYWHKKSNKFQTQIKSNNKIIYIYIGLFDSARNAARAYNTFARKIHGAFANLNNVDE